jgi:uncharacterized cupredoxin-like copper-binding protein
MWKRVLILTLTILLGVLVSGTGAGGVAQKITLTMRDFGYAPGKVTLQAGVPAEITIVNKGKVTHEFMLHARPKSGGTPKHEWAEENSYFRGLQVAVEGSGVEVRRHGANIYEINVSAGKTAVVKFTPTKRGTFEYACLIQGHYEQGMRGLLTIE